MKKLVLTLVSVIGLSASVYAQGTMLFLDNLNGTGTATATTNGLFFNNNNTPYVVGNMTLTALGGPNASSLSAIATVQMLYSGTPGVWLDSTFSTYNVSGVAPGQDATLKVTAWRGAAGSYGAAALAD